MVMLCQQGLCQARSPILASPLLRTKETAEVLAKAMKMSRRLQLVDELQPDVPPAKLIRHLLQLKHPPKRVLCVGHEPGLGELASYLLTGLAGSRFPLKKGGLVRLDIARLRTGQCAVLGWWLTPAQIKRLAG